MNQSSNHRRGTGRSKQRESKRAWLARRIAENVRLAWLLAADPEELTPEERDEQALKKDWKVWTEQELREFIK